MTSPTKFRVGLHISHPVKGASEIEAVIKLPTKYSYSVGEGRKAKSGVVLSGAYKETSITFSLHDEPLLAVDVSLERFIEEQLDLLDVNYLRELSMTGGCCFFLVGIYCEENIMYYFDSEWMLKLAANKLGLKLDFYGGPGP